MAANKPKVIVIGGPNGAGKSTAATRILVGSLRVAAFVNADVIAQGLSASEPEKFAVSAGRMMLTQLKELATQRADFAFETTLASRSFAPWIKELCASGYEFHLFYIWTPSPDFAVARVAHRVSKGGHHVSEETIRRRYFAGVRNFFELYQPLATRWRCYNGSVHSKPRLIAVGRGLDDVRIYDKDTWQQIAAIRDREQD